MSHESCKTYKKSEMKTKKIIIFLSVIATISIGYFVVRAAAWNFIGFSWIGNNLQNGVEQGDPVIGMIEMKGTNYNVTISGEGDQRPLIGSAWMGIGSTDDKFNDFSDQADYPSLGWIHFNQPFDQEKFNTLASTNCFGAGDCHGIRWNKRSGAPDGYEGYLSGWARMELGPNGDSTDYPETWVHFKSPTDPVNYSCNEGDKNYYVCADSNGKIEGYAWSAGSEATSVDGNPGLGWIKFSKKYVGFENPGCSTNSDGVCTPGCPSDPDCGVIPADSSFCTTLLDSESENIACKDSGNFSSEFKFKAYQSGITLNKSNPENNYQWVCAEGETPKTGETVTCEYKNNGTFTPELRMYNEVTKKWVDCTNQASVEIISEARCNVLVRKADDSSANDYESTLNIFQDGKIEAKIDRQCLSGGIVQWTVSGGSKISENGDLASFKPTGGATAKISAQITSNGKKINCGSANVSVRQSVKWR